jgi:FecR protein
MKRAGTLAVASGFFAVLTFPGLAPAQTGQGLGVVSTISGQATISRTSLAQPIPLQFKDSVFDRDRIATAENSTVRVLMGGKALVTVRELSVLTITEEMNRSVVDLQSGKVALGVLHQKMRPGESIEVRTHNAVAAVRGTVLVVEVVQASAQVGGGSTGLTTNVHVLHGSVDVTPTNIPGAPPVKVGQFQTYSQIGNVVGQIRPLTPAGVSQLMGNLRSSPQFGRGSGGGATDQIVSNEQSKASTFASTAGSGAVGTLPGGNGAPSNNSKQAPITPPIKPLNNTPPPPKPNPALTPFTPLGRLPGSS